MDQLFGANMGSNVVRVHYYSSDVAASGNTYLDQVKTMLLRAKSNNCGWYMACWGAPTNMKNINSIYGSVSGTGNFLKSGFEDDYAQWLVDECQYYISAGCGQPIAVALNNEPDFGHGGYEGMRLSKEQAVIMAKELRTRLNTAGLNNTLVNVSDCAGSYEDYGDGIGAVAFAGIGAGGPIETDAAYRSVVGIIGTHSYDLAYSQAQNKPVVQKFYDATHTTYTSDKQRWMTEWEPVTYRQVNNVSTDWDVLYQYITHFNRDMSSTEFHGWFSWVSYWHEWSTSGSIDYRKHFVNGQGSTSNRTALGYLMQKIWTNAPANSGFKMRRVTTDDTELKEESKAQSAWYQDFSCFTNGSKMVLTIVNSSANSKTLTINGLVGSSADIFRYGQSNAGTINQPMTTILMMQAGAMRE